MEQYHKPSNKKVGAGTGGRRRRFNDKRLCHAGGVFTATKVGPEDMKRTRRKRGGSRALKLKKAVTINVVTKSGLKKGKILKVLSSANPEYVRMGIMVKGTVVETELGKVRITNRVGQDGVINGVLVS
jgi:small subunit ribosomal protein S8e